MSQYLGGREINRALHADESAATGAALSSILSARMPEFKPCTLTALGIYGSSGRFVPFVRAHMPLPVRKMASICTSVDEQSAITIHVAENDGSGVSRMKLLIAHRTRAEC